GIPWVPRMRTTGRDSAAGEKVMPPRIAVSGPNGQLSAQLPDYQGPPVRSGPASAPDRGTRPLRDNGCMARPSVTLTFVTVVFGAEIPLLELQARSLAARLPR